MATGLRLLAGSSKGVTYLSIDGQLWHVVIPEALIADIQVVGEGGDECDHLSPLDGKRVQILPNLSGSSRLYGLAVGTSLVGAVPKLSLAWRWLYVTVKARRDYGKTILLLDNPLAVMDAGPPIEPVDMPVLNAIAGEKSVSLIARIAAKGKRSHLYLTCHRRGFSLELGGGITDGKDFSIVKDMFDTIWIGACAMLSDTWGHDFVKDIARSANCHVVASTFGLPALKQRGPNEIEAFTESSCSVCRPDGTLITENAFFGERGLHSFKLVKLGATKL